MSLRERFIGSLHHFIGGPTFLPIQLDITNACNLSCAHCYHKDHDNEGALQWEQWLDILAQYKTLLAKLRRKARFIICGGEPTMSPLLLPLLIHLRDNFVGAETTIISNGTLLRKQSVADLSQFAVNFQISFDGPNAEEHDRVRGTHSFGRSLRGLALLKAHHIKFRILSILSKRTSAMLPEFFAFAKGVGAERLNFARFMQQGQGAHLVDVGLDRALRPLELREAMQEILDFSRSAGIATNTDKALFHLLDPELASGSSASFDGINVDYQGNFKISSRADFRIGNILQEGLETLFFGNDVLRALRKGDIPSCRGCPSLTRCGGDRTAAFVTFGSFLAADPGCWRLFPDNLLTGTDS